eukprot:CAMPEP_0203785662 /NCGR_PEP_ID=MMETSP0100_2-20121128/1162_1 /ASSEMBLY_ACC=CAM_ASM_000210 /TAXON_ID=96639 /ORGANISM=" , Strain NY0313808BC1" /LENGTH=53 /DNA_ID=CAMNT_0050687811 /DNA_START=195 /DNA_END=356 /DNA_ORIENTATION=-
MVVGFGGAMDISAQVHEANDLWYSSCLDDEPTNFMALGNFAILMMELGKMDER